MIRLILKNIKIQGEGNLYFDIAVVTESDGVIDLEVLYDQTNILFYSCQVVEKFSQPGFYSMGTCLIFNFYTRTARGERVIIAKTKIDFKSGQAQILSRYGHIVVQ
ncbi:MAG: hypothetical protein NTU44_07440 [Bacteroidetes bacterium]|nr:hypothetical protein [Bacteroidota bacterium]